MSEPFLGEIRAFSFGFVPKGWAACAGQLLAINQNQALFSILGTMYGGNGVNTFALTLSASESPAHGFAVDAKSTTRSPTGATPARGEKYGPATGSTDPAGGGQPHENLPPYGVIQYAIAMVGIFPSRN